MLGGASQPRPKAAAIIAEAAEQERSNTDPAACVGIVHVDSYADGEQTVDSIILAGSYVDTLASDDELSILPPVGGG